MFELAEDAAPAANPEGVACKTYGRGSIETKRKEKR